MTLADLSVVQVLVLLLPAAIPFVVDLVTKSAAPDWLKSTLAFALSCVLGAVNAAVVTNGEHWQDYVGGILYTALLAFVTHYTGVTSGVEKATRNFGLTASTSGQRYTFDD